MAEVYLARAVDGSGRQRRYAIKRLSEELSRDPSVTAMFLDEARLASLLRHPAVVGVEEFGADEAGRAYMVLEYVDGRDLRWILAAAARNRYWLPVDFSLSVIRELCRGLAYAHEARDRSGRPLHLIHRDVSHSNIFLSRSGQVKLADFGIARARGRQSHTRTGMVKGKLGYLSPEQVRAEPLDRRTDIFSASVVLWELLTQRRMFAGASEFKTMLAVCTESRDLPSIHRPGLPPEIDQLVAKGVEIDRDKRFATAEEMALAIESVAQRLGVLLGPNPVAQVLAHLSGEPASDEVPATADLHPENKTPTRRMLVVEGVPDPSEAFAEVLTDLELDVTIEAAAVTDEAWAKDLLMPGSHTARSVPSGGLPVTDYLRRSALASTPFPRGPIELTRDGLVVRIANLRELVRTLLPDQRTVGDSLSFGGRYSMPAERFLQLAELDLGPALRSPAAPAAWVRSSGIELVGTIGDLALKEFTGRILVAQPDETRVVLLERGGLVGLGSAQPGDQLLAALVVEERGRDPEALERMLHAILLEGATAEEAAGAVLGVGREAVNRARLALAVEVLSAAISLQEKQILLEATSGWPSRGYLSESRLELVLAAAAQAWGDDALHATLSPFARQRVLIMTGLAPLAHHLGLRESARPLLEALRPQETIAEVIASLGEAPEARRFGQRLLLILIASGAVRLRQ